MNSAGECTIIKSRNGKNGGRGSHEKRHGEPKLSGDGAGKLKRIWHIDLPAIRPTIILLMIMNMGHMLSLGYEKALPFCILYPFVQKYFNRGNT